MLVTLGNKKKYSKLVIYLKNEFFSKRAWVNTESGERGQNEEEDLQQTISDLFMAVGEDSATFTEEEGIVTKCLDGIATVTGLPALQCGEVVWFEQSIPAGEVEDFDKSVLLRGLVLNLYDEDTASVVLLCNERLVEVNARVFRTKQLFKVACSLAMFGQVLDGVGRVISSESQVGEVYEALRVVERKAAGIIDRTPVRIPLNTGIKAIDTLVPVGRGQRELIIGDRQTGKTSLAVDTVLNYANDNAVASYNGQYEVDLECLRNIVWFIYNIIGQKQSTVRELYSKLESKGASWFTVFVAATAADAAALQFLSPYVACTLGEFIRDIVGGHGVVVYDDLSKHAVAYRQLSLLLRRPPGREAFPGDVFYAHSRLLERAGALTSLGEENVRGTLTALPIVETQAGDVSAYIPTNIISITDGQIFLDSELFYKGVRPAINVGLSVSRVGSAAQVALLKKVVGSLRMDLAQFREVEGFAKFGSELDSITKRTLSRGETLVQILKQELNKPLEGIKMALNLFLGLGYNASWISDIVNKTTIETVNWAESILSGRRLQFSWFECLREISPAFQLNAIDLVLTSFNKWLEGCGLVALFEENKSVGLGLGSDLVELFKTVPFIFLDDVVFAFIRSTPSLVSFPSILGSAEGGRVSLYNVALGEGVSLNWKLDESEAETLGDRGLFRLNATMDLNVENVCRQLLNGAIRNQTETDEFETHIESLKVLGAYFVEVSLALGVSVSGEKENERG